MKEYLIFGLGVSGQATIRSLQQEGASFVATCDKFEEAKSNKECAPFLSHIISPQEAFKRLKDCLAVISSPGITLSHPLLNEAKKSGIEIICDVELALRKKKASTALLAVTGTNGKTTTTELICHMLNKKNLGAKCCGNIGVSLLDEIEGSAPLVVELSSFQLMLMKTKAFQAGVVLNISPNHLDHHASFDEYSEAKLHLLDLVQNSNHFFLHESLKKTGGATFGFEKSSYLFSDGENVFREGKKESPLPISLRNYFSHDTLNYLAAYAMTTSFGLDPELAGRAYADFKKPPHRIEFIRQVDCVSYFDDSKGTNIAAVICAVGQVPSPVVLIAGGLHKGEPYTSWKEAFNGKVRYIVAIGQAAPLIEQDLKGSLEVIQATSLREAVLQAKKLAAPGGSVLLSPGCSSFDMFKDYKDRGNQFQAQVKSL